MKASLAISLVIVSTYLLTSCSHKETAVDLSQHPIVSVKDQVLYETQLKSIIPNGLSSEDSILFVDTYIKSWINNQLMINQAERNILDKKQIDKLVDDYRQSLIVNMYQDRLLREKLAENITEKELQAFYDENIELFNLNENIIKGLYLKIPINSPQLANFQKWYKQGTIESIENIEKNNLQNAVNYDYFYNKWMPFDEILEKIPQTVGNQMQYLKTNRNMEAKDSSFVYLLNIKEYRLEGTTSPFDYAENAVKEVFLEKKRVDYMNQIQNDLYDRALSKDEIKFYDK